MGAYCTKKSKLANQKLLVRQSFSDHGAVLLGIRVQLENFPLRCDNFFSSFINESARLTVVFLHPWPDCLFLHRIWRLRVPSIFVMQRHLFQMDLYSKSTQITCKTAGLQEMSLDPNMCGFALGAVGLRCPMSCDPTPSSSFLLSWD